MDGVDETPAVSNPHGRKSTDVTMTANTGLAAVRSPQQDHAVLVTGAAGLIGVPVVRQLLKSGYRVVGVDNGSAGTLWRMEEFTSNPAFRLCRVDIRSHSELAALAAKERPWGVMHLAARHFIPDCERNPGETLSVNILGTQYLLDACAASPPRRLLFASTADVYDPSDSPHAEDAPVNPIGVYGCSKLVGEQMMRDQAHRMKNCDIVIARLFNVFGPGDPHPHLLPEVLRQLRTKPVLRLGDLASSRDFVYVDDAATALVALLELAPPGTFNVGTGASISGRQIVDLASRLSGCVAPVELDASRLRRITRPHLRAVPHRMRALLPNWPQVGLAEGIARTIAADAAAPGGAS